MLGLLVIGAAVSAVCAQTCSQGCVTPNRFNFPTAPGMKVRFDNTGSIGETYFFDIPRTLETIQKKGYRQTAKPQGRAPEGLQGLKLYCPNEKNFCVLFDDTGYIAGVQYAVNIDRYTDAVFDWQTQGFEKWTVDGKDYWAIQIYFVTKEHLKINRNERIASRTNATLQLDGIWLTHGVKRSLLHVPKSAAAMEAAGFVRQGCVQNQGLHYLYKPETIKCTSETWIPWLPIVNGGQLTGCIFNTFGRLPPKAGERNWFEDVTSPVVRLTLPAAPKCVSDLVDKYGFINMHTFFFGNPWTITCCPVGGQI